MRLDKFLSNLKYGSRKDIKNECRNKNVLINGEIEKNPGKKIDPKIDVVTFMGEEVASKGIVYLILNKPKGYVSANRDTLHKTVIDLLPEEYQRLNLAIGGRLDIDTTGLVILSNDGTYIHEITNPKKEVYKTYEVTLRDNFKEEYHNLFKEGLLVRNGRGEEYKTKPAKLEKVSDKKCIVQICEGKYHQVKRMFICVGNEVLDLNRTSVGDIELGDLEIGQIKEYNI